MPVHSERDAIANLLLPTNSLGATSSEQEWRDRDLVLAKRLAARDEDAMHEFITLHGTHLKRIIGGLLAWNGDVDDMLQETLIKVWKQSPSFRADAPLQNWATRIAIRVCRNHQRSLGRYFRHLAQFWTDKQVANAPTPSHLSDDRWERIQHAMSNLNYADREIIVLIHLEDVSIDSLSKDWGIRTETLHVRLHRARMRLASLLHRDSE